MASAWAKYHWANKHMKTVEAAIGRSLDPDLHSIPLKIKSEVHGNVATALARIGGLPIIRTDCGLALGDVLQNFRASLDHLAWGLVKIGSDPSPAKPQRVYFPMAKSGKSFEGQINEWLPGVPSEYRTLIRRYQPYRRGNGPKAIRWLRNLSDVDKHRVLVPAVINVARMDCRVTSNWTLSDLDYLVPQPRALHVGAPVLRVRLRRTSGAECQVQVESQFRIYPSLGRGVPMGDSLALIKSTVFEILSTFDEVL